MYEKPERQDDIARLRGLIRDFASCRRILEVAAGTGYWTVVATGSADSVYATDLAEEPLALARSRKYAGAVEFGLCDAFALDTIAGNFNGGLACFWLSHLRRPEMARFTAHLSSRLEPGSRVLFVDNRYVTGSSSPITRTDADGNNYQRRTLHSGETFDVLKNFPDGSELRALGEAYGTDVELTELTYYWALSFTTFIGSTPSSS